VLQKQGRVQLGGRSDATGKLWPKPAECAPGANASGNVTGAGDYDYAAGDYASSQPAVYEHDYDYGSYDVLPSGPLPQE
jgi:hypothetical protein